MTIVRGLGESRVNLLGLDPPALCGFFAALGERDFRAGQLLKWVYQRGVTEFDAMTDLSKTLRAHLGRVAELRLPETVRDQVGADDTRKWLLRLDDGNCIETVFIPDGERRTLCISSQVGCALNCSFCATARQGFNRNLTTAEIVGQVWLAAQLLKDDRESGIRPLSNVVLMGMGEALLNFDAVVAAIRLLLDDRSFGLSRRRVTLSTAGLIPGIERLGRECPVSLAVSLHAPDDALRDQLVPLNRKYPLEVLIDACRRYTERDPRSKVTFEYTMMAGVNDSPGQAAALARLLRRVPAKVNLIPFNPVAGVPYRRSDARTIDRFRDVLLGAGIMTITRKTRGDDINAACGQLAGDFLDRTRRSARATTVHRAH